MAQDVNVAPRRGKHAAHAKTDRARLSSSLPTVGPLDEQGAPRPIGVDPQSTGAFSRIASGEGATVETRDNIGRISPDSTSSWRRTGLGDDMRLTGRNRPRVSGRSQGGADGTPSLMAQLREHWLIMVAAGLMIVLGLLFLRSCLVAPSDGPDPQQGAQQTQTAADGTLTYQGTTFSLRRQDDGTYALVGQTPDAQSGETYMQLSGTPVQLVLYNGAIIIPENLDGSWDVLAYTVGTGSVGAQVVDADERPVGGSGQIVKVELSGSNLLVTDDAGTTTTVSLA